METIEWMIESLLIFDEYCFRLINSSGWDMMDQLMILISSKWFWIPLYLYIVYLLYKKFPEQFYKIIFSIGLLVFISDHGSVHLFKEVFERFRPSHASIEGIRVVDGPGGKFGFISSHASNAFALAFFISLIFRNYWGFVHLFSWAVLIGFSRVYLGVHYPLDILGGMFWGLFVSLLVYYIYKMKIKNLDWVWLVWVSFVCIWNFGWPDVPPIADVLVAIIFSIFVLLLKKKLKK